MLGCCYVLGRPEAHYKKKDIKITTHTIRFLPIEKNESVPLDMIMVLGLFSLWKSRMDVRHAAAKPKSAPQYFTELVCQVKSVFEFTDNTPDWADLLHDLLCMKEF